MSRSSFLFDLALERREMRLPKALDEVRNRRESVALDRVQATRTGLVRLDQARLVEHGEVLGCGLLRDIDRVGDLRHAARTALQDAQDLHASRLAERP